MPLAPFSESLVDRFINRMPQKLFEYSKQETGERFTRDRTAAIMQILAELATEERVEQRCSGSDYGCEFLLDFTWIDPKSQVMKLAVESELKWSVSEVTRDLRKLLYIKCNTKLVICDPYPCESLKVEVEDVLSGYSDHRRGEEYVVLQLGCCYRTQERPCGCQPVIWRWSPMNDGQTKRVSLERIEKEWFPLVQRRTAADAGHS